MWDMMGVMIVGGGSWANLGSQGHRPLDGVCFWSLKSALR